MLSRRLAARPSPLGLEEAIGGPQFMLLQRLNQASSQNFQHLIGVNAMAQPGSLTMPMSLGFSWQVLDAASSPKGTSRRLAGRGGPEPPPPDPALWWQDILRIKA
jgi:hypothetical protein